MEALFIILLVGAPGIYFFFILPELRGMEVRALIKALEAIGGGGCIDSSKKIFTKKEFNFRKCDVEVRITHQLGLNKLLKYMDTLERKKSQMTYTDDYGRVRDEAWRNELRYVVRNLLLPIDTSLLGELEPEYLQSQAYRILSNVRDKETVEGWVDFIDVMVAGHDEVVSSFDECMTGHEYEFYVAGLLENLGWDAKVTQGSGDHGADIIAEKNGVRVAVQCKLFSSPVGNGSVQEAFSAKSFYDCDKACVVTNSSFTPSAKKSAAKLGIPLLHHNQLETMF